MERKIHGCIEHLNFLEPMWLTNSSHEKSPQHAMSISPQVSRQEYTCLVHVSSISLPAWVRGIHCLETTLGVEWALGTWFYPILSGTFFVTFIITDFFPVIICYLSPLGFHFLIWKMMKINSKFPLNSKLYVSNGKLHGYSGILRTQSVIVILSSNPK